MSTPRAPRPIAWGWFACAVGAALALACSPAGEQASRDAGPPAGGSAAVQPAAVAAASAESPAADVRISVGMAHACALRPDGRLYCWGDNSVHQLGIGSDSEAVAQPHVVVGPRRFRDVAAGSPMTCAVAVDGGGYCWGVADEGQLGTGALADSSAVPRAVAGAHRYRSIVATPAGACALDTDGAAWCWGRYETPSIDQAPMRGRAAPMRVAAPLRFRALAMRIGGACGVAEDGRAYCWGVNGSGELGDRTTTKRATPDTVAALAGVVGIALGESHACAIDGEGAAWCWGDNRLGQLGTGSSGDSLERSTVPARVAGAHRYRVIASNAVASHTCALDLEGTAWCWGANASGVLGGVSGQTCAVERGGRRLPCATQPVAVPGGHRFTRISVGPSESCGATTDGGLFCWGTPTYDDGPLPPDAPAPRALVLPDAAPEAP